MNNKSLSRLLLLSGLVALLVMGLLFDLGATVMSIRNTEGLGLEPVMAVLFPIAAVILVTGGLWLFWYQVSRPERDRLVGWIYAIVGLLLVFSTTLLFFLPVPMSVYALVRFVSPGSFLFQVAAILGVAGVFSLVLKRTEVKEIKEAEEGSL
jgi:hypothetical protein